MKKLICWLRGHGPTVSCIKDIGGRMVYTHDYCERCGKVLRLNWPGYIQDIWAEEYKTFPTEYKDLL